jgi:hypothetical protein
MVPDAVAPLEPGTYESKDSSTGLAAREHMRAVTPLTGPIHRMRRETVAACVLFLAAAAYFVFVELRRDGIPAFDVYIYFIPNKIHAAYSFWHGGKGLLWNPFQSCGEPFFGNPSMGLLYPPNLLFLVLEPNLAVHLVLIINMVLGAVGMLLLLRELGLGWAAAVGGALAFELGDPMAQLTGWSPMHSGPWTWLPWALLACERLLRVPTRLGIAGLAAAVTLALLPGWVLIAVLTCQLIALRVAWELLTRGRPRPWRSVAAIAAGLTLGLLLAAIQVLPAAEVARESFRVAVEALEFARFGTFEDTVLSGLRWRMPPVPFTVTLIVLACVAPFVGTHRRLVLFYLLTGALYAVLALGTATPLFSLYAKIPPGAAAIKYPMRLWWMTAFSLAVLTAFCLDGLSQRGQRSALRRVAAAVAAALALALYVWAPGGLRSSEAVALAGLLAALFAASLRPQFSRPAAWVAVGCIALNVVAVPLRHAGQLLPSAENLRRHEATFAALDPPLTAQDRIFLVTGGSTVSDLSLVQKTATVLRVPDLSDYEPLLGRRYWEYAGTMWRAAGPVTTAADFDAAVAASRFERRLLDLASIRYVITAPSVDLRAKGLDLPRSPAGDSGLHIHRNDAALPRARYVPRIEVVSDPSALLERLGKGNDDLAAVAFVETPPPSGFTGTDAVATAATTRFVTNDPEHLAIDVDAPAKGFLLLADQYYPGWYATVNGQEVPIQRANYVFRLVEVPAGSSRVEFRYRPASVIAGAAVSLAALGAFATLVWLGSSRSHARA